MPPDAQANPEYALCRAYVRLKGLAVLAVALVGLPTYAMTRRQLKNCADLWDFQTAPSPKVAQK